MLNSELRSYIKLSIALPLFMVLCLISTAIYADESTNETAVTDDGRKMSREAQVALLESQRRYQTNPEDWASAREPLIEFLKTPKEELIPFQMYRMLGYLWYFDEKNAKHIEEAYKVYKAGHEAFPEDLELLQNYATASFHLDKFAEAAPLFEEYFNLDEKHDIKYLANAAQSFYTAENLDEAKRVYVKMIELVDSPKGQWLDALVVISQTQKNLKETEKYVWLALKYYPTEKKYWKLLASIFGDREDYIGLAAAYEIGTRVEMPDQKSEWQSLIELYDFQYLFLRTAESTQMGMDLLAKADGSSEEEQQLNVATAYARGARVDKAVSYLDSVIATNPSYELKLKKATILYEARRNREALAALEDCIETNVKGYSAYYIKGWIAWDMKDWKTATEAFEAASASRDDNIRIDAMNALDMLASLNKAKNE